MPAALGSASACLLLPAEVRIRSLSLMTGLTSPPTVRQDRLDQSADPQTPVLGSQSTRSAKASVDPGLALTQLDVELAEGGEPL